MANNIATEIGILQSWTDFSPNLFEVSIFGVDSSSNPTSSLGTTIPQNKDSINIGESIRHYCTAFEIEPASLELERHELTKKHFIKDYVFSDQISLTWKEDANLSVWRYHNSWLDRFYDRSKDHFIKGSIGKKRTMVIKFQRFNTSSGKIPTYESLIDTVQITVSGLIPTAGLGIRGDWASDSGEDYTKEITYKFDNWSFTIDKNEMFNYGNSLK